MKKLLTYWGTGHDDPNPTFITHCGVVVEVWYVVVVVVVDSFSLNNVWCGHCGCHGHGQHVRCCCWQVVVVVVIDMWRRLGGDGGWWRLSRMLTCSASQTLSQTRHPPKQGQEHHRWFFSHPSPSPWLPFLWGSHSCVHQYPPLGQ